MEKTGKKAALADAVNLLAQAEEALIISHVAPDGDTLGSALALAWVLETRGTAVTCFCEEEAPANLRFLPGIERIVHVLPSEPPRLVVFADCAEARRAGPQLRPETLRQTTTVNIDHHVSNSLYADWNYVDTKAAATGELVYGILRRLGPVKDERVALCLYTAIVTDTGRFSFSGTTARSLRVAAALRPYVDVAALNEMIYERRPLAQGRLLERALARLTFPAGGKIALVALSLADYAAAGAELNMSEGVINYIRAFQGVEAAVLLKEAESGLVRVSMRSNGAADVNRVAGRFGGGGHKRAAGCVCRRDLRAATEEVLKALKEEMDSGRDD
ncbi:MAG: bifunctional oligoribonuclease/PAP phosphatase NrnA [Gracilibacteraceae bacterium]|jgi:phosphoesterase RecJ-like protein|nr:bifunctional oligoribonuclease/PAP phosphatase NrnA [Gracilibacteraceae bacterium]